MKLMSPEPLNLEQLAIYIKYVIRPRRVIHFSTDRGAFARECEKLGLDALAIDLNSSNDALCSNVIHRDWRQLPIAKEDMYPEPLDNIPEPLLILVTNIPTDGIYFTARNMLSNWTLFGDKLWLFDNDMDRWIYDVSHMSYIVDLPATIHAVSNAISNVAVDRMSLNHVIFKRTY